MPLTARKVHSLSPQAHRSVPRPAPHSLRDLGWTRGGGGWAFLSVVRRPLDLLYVVPLLHHLAERGHLAQAVHLADHEGRHVIDLGLGVEPADAEADARVGQLVADAQRPQ